MQAVYEILVAATTLAVVTNFVDLAQLYYNV